MSDETYQEDRRGANEHTPPRSGRAVDLFTSSEAAAAPLLLIGIGNPSRGDDALGPASIEALEAMVLPSAIDLLTEFQLQVEHVLDLARCSQVVFVDASLDCATAFSFEAVEPDTRMTHSHALSPAQLLGAYQRVHDSEPPRAKLLAIRGYEFELGAPLSDTARSNLDAALRFLMSWLPGVASCAAAASR